jgi:hypothetical protein
LIELRAPGYEPASFWVNQEQNTTSNLSGTLKPKQKPKRP